MNAQAKKQIVVRIIDSVISLALMFALRILQTTAYFHQNHRVINAICDPLSAAVIPLALLLAIHMPLAAMIDKCTYRKPARRRHPKVDKVTVEPRTLHESSKLCTVLSYTNFQPSDSTLYPERMPIAKDKQQRYNYMV